MKDFDLNSLLPTLTSMGLRLLGGILVLVVGLVILHFVRKRIARARMFSKMEPTAAGFIRSAITVVLYLVVLLSAAGVLGVPLTIFVTVISLAGAAISLAVQGALSNFIGGLIILILKPFRVGNYIKVGDTDGSVRAIGLYYTTLVTPDGKEISLPNSNLTGTAIVNFSKEEQRRIDMDFGVSYSEDSEEVRRVLLSAAEACPEVLKDPAPQVLLQELRDSAVLYRLRVYTKNTDYWTAYYALTEGGKAALNAAGLTIPFPQVDVHVKPEA